MPKTSTSTSFEGRPRSRSRTHPPTTRARPPASLAASAISLARSTDMHKIVRQLLDALRDIDFGRDAYEIDAANVEGEASGTGRVGRPDRAFKEGKGGSRGPAATLRDSTFAEQRPPELAWRALLVGLGGRRLGQIPSGCFVSA